MTNFRDILKNFIGANMRKSIHEGRVVWYVPYSDPKIFKEPIEGESLDEVVDYFYNAVLQYEYERNEQAEV